MKNILSLLSSIFILTGSVHAACMQCACSARVHVRARGAQAWGRSAKGKRACALLILVFSIYLSYVNIFVMGVQKLFTESKNLDPVPSTVVSKLARTR